MLLVLFPWGWRNHRALDRWILTSTNSGITQYDGFNPNADGSSNQNFIQQMPELRRMSELERNDYLATAAREYASVHPLGVLELAVRKICRTWSPIPLSAEFGSHRLYILIAAGYSIPLDLLVLWGLWSGTLPRSAKVFLLIPAIYFTLAHALSIGSLRYRIPAEVPMAIVVASGRWSVARRESGRWPVVSGQKK
jgi:hypothetical protein